MPNERIQRIIEMVDELDYENGPDALSEFYPIAEFFPTKAAIEEYYGDEVDTDHYADDNSTMFAWLVRECTEDLEGAAVLIRSYNGEDEFMLEVSLAAW